MIKLVVFDLGGTLINENISRASGASHGQETTEGSVTPKTWRGEERYDFPIL